MLLSKAQLWQGSQVYLVDGKNVSFKPSALQRPGVSDQSFLLGYVVAQMDTRRQRGGTLGTSRPES